MDLISHCQPTHHAAAENVAQRMLAMLVAQRVEDGDSHFGVARISVCDWLLPEPIAQTKV